MKKIFVLLLPLLALMSCGNTYIYDGFTVKSYNVHVDETDWQYTNYTENGSPYANNYFYCVIDMPEISSFAFDKGDLYGDNNGVMLTIRRSFTHDLGKLTRK
jgi:hypothetical protein